MIISAVVSLKRSLNTPVSVYTFISAQRSSCGNVFVILTITLRCIFSICPPEFHCSCPSPYFGSRCENGILPDGPCASQPCANGLCVPNNQGYICDCSAQISGNRWDSHSEALEITHAYYVLGEGSQTNLHENEYSRNTGYKRYVCFLFAVCFWGNILKHYWLSSFIYNTKAWAN